MGRHIIDPHFIRNAHLIRDAHLTALYQNQIPQLTQVDMSSHNCQHCGKSECARYFTLRYNYLSAVASVPLKEFAENFDRYVAKSGVKLRRYLILEDFNEPLSIFVYLDLAEPDRNLAKRFGSASPTAAFTQECHKCDQVAQLKAYNLNKITHHSFKSSYVFGGNSPGVSSLMQPQHAGFFQKLRR